MSLIHKALKKNGGSDTPGGPTDPEEAFVGKGGGFFSTQASPRTLVLLVLALACLGFMIWKNVIRKPPGAPAVAVPASLGPAPVPDPAAAAPVAPAAGGAQPTAGVAPAMGEGRKETTPSTLLPEVAVLVDEGKEVFAAGQYDTALEKFNAAAALAPEEAVVWNNIGLVQKRKQNMADAEQAYQKALEYRPDYPEGLNNLGVLKAAQGDRLSASIYLKKALTLDPTYADAHFNLAVILEQEGNWRSAVDAYKAFLQYTASTDKTLLEQVERRVEALSP